jgi:hypothetical protein
VIIGAWGAFWWMWNLGAWGAFWWMWNLGAWGAFWWMWNLWNLWNFLTIAAGAGTISECSGNAHSRVGTSEKVPQVPGVPHCHAAFAVIGSTEKKPA